MIRRKLTTFFMWFFGKSNWYKLVLVAIGLWMAILFIAMIIDSIYKTSL